MCLVNVCTWQTNVRDIHGGGTYMVDRRVDVRGDVVDRRVDVRGDVVDRRTWWTDVWGGPTCGRTW